MPLLLLGLAKVAVVSDPAKKDVEKCKAIVSEKDAPILAGAIQEKAGYLITLDKPFQKGAGEYGDLKVMLPAEFIQQFKK